MPSPETDYRLALLERQAEMNVLPLEKQIQILSVPAVGPRSRGAGQCVYNTRPHRVRLDEGSRPRVALTGQLVRLEVHARRLYG
jgi:hypothetical protein